MKYELILSDQFRQLHFPVGVLLSQLCMSPNENKEQRKLSIGILIRRSNIHSHKQARIASL